MEEEKINIINDIIWNEDGKSYPVNLFEFFPKANLKAILHNNGNIFNDVKFIINTKKINLTKKKRLSVGKLKNKNFYDIIGKKLNKLKLKEVLKFKKERILINPLCITTPLPELSYNSLDIRQLKESPIFKTYPDIYQVKRPSVKKYIKKLKNIKNISENIYKKHKSFFHRWAVAWFIAFIISVSLVLIWIWFKNYIQAEVIDSYQKIYSFKNLRSWEEIKNEAKKVKRKLSILSFLFAPVNALWNNILYKNDDIILANNVIKWGTQIWDIMVNIWQIYSDFEEEVKVNKDLTWIKKLQNIKITTFLKNENPYILNIKESLNNAITYYSKINSLPDKSLNSKFQLVMENLVKSSSILDYYIANEDILLEILWDKKPVRYLILNQNKDEIRANWGFPGSVITLELYKWNIKNYDKKDVYYYDWHITPYRETPPEWLNIISPNHGLRDANYLPIFRESAEKINFFYEKWGWSSLDWVIAINQGLVEDFLKKYWSVRMDEINLDVTSSNFSLIMSTLVENKFQKVISPKDILFKFWDKLEKKLLEKKDFIGYIDIILNNFITGEILIASRNPDIENFIKKYTTSENWLKDEWNWFYPVFTSISWNKSDRYISRVFNLKTTVNSDCSILNSLNLTSTHNFWEKQIAEIRTILDDLKITDNAERDRLMTIEWWAENRQFVRVLVPKWTELITKIPNVNLDSSNPNYDFIKFYLNTPVWETSQTNFEYITHPKTCTTKTNFYRQSGLTNYKININ